MVTYRYEDAGHPGVDVTSTSLDPYGLDAVKSTYNLGSINTCADVPVSYFTGYKLLWPQPTIFF